jgi:nucleotide-binding universal stress UspA family protein
MVQTPLRGRASSWRRRSTRPVLLADRGADDAAVARRAAADLAARAGVPVRLVTAWEVPPLAVVTPTTSDVDVWGLFEDSARAAQREVRHHLAALGSKVDAGYVAEGSTPAVVARTADMIDASVVVIGSRAGGGLRGHLLGLLPEAVVRSAHRPVLVVRGESAVWPPRAIIIGEGCSPGVPSVALDGARLARVLAVPAVLVRVIPHPGQTRFDESGEPSAASVREELRGRACGTPASGERSGDFCMGHQGRPGRDSARASVGSESSHGARPAAAAPLWPGQGGLQSPSPRRRAGAHRPGVRVPVSARFDGSFFAPRP